MENQIELFCPSCKSVVKADANFCPVCGKQLKDEPIGAPFTKQAIVYFVSFFLPPFGLIYAVKYLKQGDYESRKIGFISIILTAISILAAIWMTLGIVNSITQSFNEINSLGI